MSLADTLKEATAQAHREAEQRDLQRKLVKGVLAEAALTDYLAQLELVHAALEERIDAHAPVAEWLGWSDEHRHSRRLASDLTALGAGQHTAHPATTRLLDEITAATTREPASLLGFFYVLEGSMNGNRFIVRALKHGPLGARCAFTYFDPYGDEQRSKWIAFREAIDTATLDEAQADAVHEAAARMFAGIAAISDDVAAAHASAVT